MLSLEERIGFLKRSNLFESLTEDELSPIAEKAREESYSAGTYIFREDDAGGALYVVIKGAVNIIKQGIFIRSQCEGDIFGEMALLDGRNRSASAAAAVQTELLLVDRDDFVRATEGEWSTVPKILAALSGIFRQRSDSFIKRAVEHEEAVRRMDYTIRLNKYMEIGKALTSTLNVNDILTILLDRLSSVISATGMLVYMIARDNEAMLLRNSAGFEALDPAVRLISLDKRMNESVCERLKPLVVEDIASHKIKDFLPPPLVNLIEKSALFVPLGIRQVPKGLLCVIDPKEAHLFQQEQRPFLEILADYVSVALANATNFETIELLSVTDDVTGFYNTRFLHRYLDELLVQARKLGREISLVFFDLDNFKRTVDSHGHLLGSKVLKEVAHFVDLFLDREDRIVRYGGDEYIVILPWQTREHALTKVEAIRTGLEKARFLRDENINEHVSASFGIATFPHDAIDTKELLRQADRYMYHSKNTGKNRVSARKA